MTEKKELLILRVSRGSDDEEDADEGNLHVRFCEGAHREL
jgi:hypothetical protein